MNTRDIYIQHGQVIGIVLSNPAAVASYFVENGMYIEIPFLYNKKVHKYIIETDKESLNAHSRIVIGNNTSRIPCRYKRVPEGKWVFEFQNDINDSTTGSIVITVDTKRKTIRFEYEMISKVNNCTTKNLVFGTTKIRVVDPKLLLQE